MENTQTRGSEGSDNDFLQSLAREGEEILAREKLGLEQMQRTILDTFPDDASKDRRYNLFMQTIQNCAYESRNSTVENSLAQAKSHYHRAVLKTIATAVVTPAIVAMNYFASKYCNAGALILTIPASLGVLSGLAMSVIGGDIPHPVVNRYNNYPTWSISRELDFARGWKKIAKLQQGGKITQGNGKVSTSDGYGILIGGP